MNRQAETFPQPALSAKGKLFSNRRREHGYWQDHTYNYNRRQTAFNGYWGLWEGN